MSSKSRVRFLKTIGFKITLWYTLSVLLMLIVLGPFLYFRLRHTLNKETDHILFDECEEILQRIQDNNYTKDDLLRLIKRETAAMKYLRKSVRLYDTEQRSFIGSENFIAPYLKLSDDDIAKTVKGEYTLKKIWVKGSSSPYRLITRSVNIDNSCKYILQVAIYMKLTYKTVENMEENFLMLTPFLVILSIAGGWFLSRKSLTPIARMTETARQITGSDLKRRILYSHTGDELDELANTINMMLDRIETSFSRIIQFTSDVSHELRTPVAALKTGTEVMLSRQRTAGEYRDLLEHNLITLERMVKIISDLLELSRSDSGQNILHLKPFKLGNMLNELRKTFRPVSDSKNILSPINEIPNVQICGDEIMLRRVFSNLLDNAIKYTPPGGRVYISLEDRNDDVVVSITDTGVGIAEENLGKIFDRCFRVDTSRSREAGGSGLGLNISKAIVELHKGRIEVKSDLGVGSTFDVILPKNPTKKIYNISIF
ncbi:MAG: heavy metal sensor histidine kinase [Candidatus Scalindua rubra]|uniref:histidine kinase n=1 Tax=Candidatus Scalindua brodae TaxID=237368 RepID=A0A0B0EDA9_9BACT|nr:MAG: putative histidine kinase protein [Candidatus Scalindua brodae]MBZ0107156.1 heavy metal sensor histidine kinase [Candidatus Scalindua rubra]TWU38075.1 Sensor kinase CusS [Candidatus Brocadiaceae bacterium S225]